MEVTLQLTKLRALVVVVVAVFPSIHLRNIKEQTEVLVVVAEEQGLLARRLILPHLAEQAYKDLKEAT